MTASDPLGLLSAEPPTLRQKFADYLARNPDFWPMFERFSLTAARSGRKKFSAWLIVNRIRWEHLIQLTDQHYDFKIANDYIALCARKFMQDHPEHEGLFNTKPMRRA